MIYSRTITIRKEILTLCLDHETQRSNINKISLPVSVDNNTSIRMVAQLNNLCDSLREIIQS